MPGKPKSVPEHAPQYFMPVDSYIEDVPFRDLQGFPWLLQNPGSSEGASPPAPADPRRQLPPVGPYLTLSGWSDLHTYPRFVYNWAFFKSANKSKKKSTKHAATKSAGNTVDNWADGQRWGPSRRLRADLQEFANVYEFPEVAPGSLTYEEGKKLGWSEKRVDQYNGKPPEDVFNERLTSPRGQNFHQQDFRNERGWRIHEVDGVIEEPSLWFGPTDHVNQVKAGYSDAVRQAQAQADYFVIPVETARRAGVTGKLSVDGTTVLIERPTMDFIRKARFRGGLKALAGGALGVVSTPLDILGGWNAYQAGAEPFRDWALTTSPSYLGSVAGAGLGAVKRAAVRDIISLASKGGGVGSVLGLGATLALAEKELAETDPQLAAALAYTDFAPEISSQVYDPSSVYYVPPNPAKPRWEPPSIAPLPWRDRSSPMPYFPEELAAAFSRLPDDGEPVHPDSAGVNAIPIGVTRLADIGRSDFAQAQPPRSSASLPAWARTYVDQNGALKPLFEGRPEDEPFKLPVWEWYQTGAR